MIWHPAQRLTSQGIAQHLQLPEQAVRLWLKRFNAARVPGLQAAQGLASQTRTRARLSTCRPMLVRYDKHGQPYLGLLKLACALISYRRHHHLTVLS